MLNLDSMLLKHSEELTVLHYHDGGVTVHRGFSSTSDSVTLDTRSYAAWWRLAEMFREAEHNPALNLLLEQAEFIYDLSRGN